jgi:hypothetical protein
MLIILFKKYKTDILKVSILLALWMYSIINIVPTEVFIFKINTYISKIENTKILQYQSHILSIDIINSVKNLK